MPALASTAGKLVQSCARQQLPAVRASCAAVQKRSVTSSFDNPFQGTTENTTRIPSFDKYKASGSETKNKLFSYFMVGTMGAVSAMGAKNTVQGASLSDPSTIRVVEILQKHNWR